MIITESDVNLIRNTKLLIMRLLIMTGCQFGLLDNKTIANFKSLFYLYVNIRIIYMHVQKLFPAAQFSLTEIVY